MGIFLIVITFIVGSAGCGPISIEIRDWHDLDAVRDNMRGSYILMNDLDSTTAGYEELASAAANEGKGWQPVGGIAVNDGFVGSFDGQGYEIHDLFINRPDESYVGLFGLVEAGGTIENVGIVNGNVIGYDSVGGLVGKNEGTVRSSYACGNVTGDLGVGSLVGVNGGTVANSYSSGRVIGRDDIGGLVGENEGTVSNSYSVGTVSGNDFIGNLVGVNGGTVSNSYTSGSVNGSDFVGGLVGRNEGTVSKCYSMGSVAGNEYAGGLVGQNLYGVVSNSVWDTQTSGQATSDGGIGKTTAEMMDIDTFTGATWDIVAISNSGDRNTGYVWNIVDDVAYPFLSWQPV
ncbi:MAG: hypothetical protein A2Z77_04310 [Chloroflexi bacterium RBG_13_51_36]|nr:MAG: hypothetical protein A2Z77_04310 [Chloroflexi bacterium RBG_13_51_36]